MSRPAAVPYPVVTNYADLAEAAERSMAEILAALRSREAATEWVAQAPTPAERARRKALTHTVRWSASDAQVVYDSILVRVPDVVALTDIMATEPSSFTVPFAAEVTAEDPVEALTMTVNNRIPLSVPPALEADVRAARHHPSAPLTGTLRRLLRAGLRAEGHATTEDLDQVPEWERPSGQSEGVHGPVAPPATAPTGDLNLYFMAINGTWRAHDTVFRSVVRAETEERAREIMSKEALDEGAKTWLNPKKSECTCIATSVGGEPGVVAREYVCG